MSCGSGCTDCPTCRGEVQPDAPVMKDMAFAMAMARGPMGQDAFLGPYGVLQTVLDGVRQRGNLSAADRSVLTHLHSVVERSGAQGGPVMAGGIVVPPPYGPILPTSPDGSGDGNRQRDLARQKGVTVETPRRVVLLIPTFLGGEGREYGRRKKRKSGAECCVREFRFPDELSAFHGPSSQSAAVTVGGFHFTTKAIFDNEFTKAEGDPRVCDCSCCEYEQYVTYLENEMNGTDRTTPEQRFLVEDCVWWYKKDEGVDGVVPVDKRRKAIDELPPVDSNGDPSSDIGTLCYGEKGDEGADPKGMRTSGGYVSECFYETCDEPRRALDKQSKRRFAWLFMGQIVDVCHNRTVLAREWLYLKMEKEAGVGEIPTFTAGAGGPGGGAAIPGTERKSGDDSECP